MRVQRVALGSQQHTLTWLMSTHQGQQVLAAAHANGTRPRCLCIPAGIEMYIARRKNTFYLARRPGTGMLHAPDCPSMEDVNLFSGASRYAAEAIVELPDGGLQIRYAESSAHSPGAQSVGIDGLLDLLIETASLNEWETSKAERSWPSVRDRLISAAGQILMDGNGSIASCLLLPVNFDKSTYDRQRLADEAFLSGADDTRFILAPLREARASQFGWQLSLKHAPRTKFWISKRLGHELEARSAGTIQLDAVDFPALCLARTRRTRGEGFAVEALALRRIDRGYMPCLSNEESLAAAQLAAKSIPHIRPLRFDMPFDTPLCDYAITDRGGSLWPVFVMEATGSTLLDATKREQWRIATVGGQDAYCFKEGVWHPAPPESAGRSSRYPERSSST